MLKNEIKDKYNVPELIAQVLSYSKLSQNQIDDVLFSSDELSVNNCDALIYVKKRIVIAKEKNEKILVVGDYDCDGICATAIMKDTLKRLDIEHGYYIPNRFKEGYGINETIVNLAYEKGYSLIITVDNGITAKSSINLCNELGIDIIITDHHTRQDDYDWDCLLHPSVMDQKFEAMCGAGVALMISMSLLGEIKEHVILACIATIGDMMPVFKENRVIIKRGIQYLNERNYTAIELLLDRKIEKWDEIAIAFNVVPKLNAIGRMADQVNANNVVRYLVEHKLKDLEAGAKQIKAINLKRKKLSKSYSEQVLANLKDEKFHIIVEDEFHEGLIGLVANQVTSNTKKPCMVFCKKSDIYKGSARSTPQMSLFDFLSEFKHYMSEFGGHHFAAGIQIPVDNMDKFKEAVLNKMENYPLNTYIEDTISISASDCTTDAVMMLERIRPFGQGFESPLFKLFDFQIVKKQVLKDKYPKWNICSETNEVEVVSFSINKSFIEKNVDAFVGTLTLNHFRGINTVCLQATNIETD